MMDDIIIASERRREKREMTRGLITIDSKVDLFYSRAGG